MTKEQIGEVIEDLCREVGSEGKEPTTYEGHTYKDYWSPTFFICNHCGLETSDGFNTRCVEIDGVKHCMECAEKLVGKIGYVAWHEDGYSGLNPVYPWEYWAERMEEVFQVPKEIMDTLNESYRLYGVFREWLRGTEEEIYQRMKEKHNE